MLLRVLILLSGIAMGTAQAQTPVALPNPPDAFWQLPPSVGNVANEATIRQAGAGNQATLVVLAGSQNQVELSQMTNSNAATIRVTGHANGLILNQSGGGNTVNIGLSGNDNRLKFTQDGGDVARLPGLTGSNTKLELVQRNGNNTFVADGPTAMGGTTGPGAANLRIEQTGGSTVRIQTGRLTGQ